MRRASILLLALALALVLVGCAPTEDQGAAATAVAQVKGGFEAQRKAVEAFGTQVPGAQEKVATAVAGAPAVATQVAVSPEKVATAAVATVQAVAPNVKLPLPAGAAPMTEDQVRQIAQDALARALNVPPGQVAIERVEEVEWSDASLGCPQPGMMYAQVITPGFRIVANVNGQRKQVHADRAGRAVVCDRPSP